MKTYFATVTNFTAPWNDHTGNKSSLIAWCKKWSNNNIRIEIRDNENRKEILYSGLAESGEEYAKTLTQ